MSKKQKKYLLRIIISLILFIILFILDHTLRLGSVIPNDSLSWILPAALYLIVYLIIGYDVILKAINNILHGQVFDENFLMLIATIGAFVIRSFEEAVAVMLFYQVGEFFQGYAVGKTRKSISILMDIRPDFANVLRDGNVIIVDPDEVKINDIIIVNPGEKIPLDGIVIEGDTALDVKALTGESLPKDVAINDEVISGSVNLSKTIHVRVTKEFYDSTVNKILDLVENASSYKSKSENFISKFARYYTPIVVVLAVLLAIVPGVITKNYMEWIYRALNFLVVSCPCALVISVPLSFFAGIGACSKKGILVKGSNYLEKLNEANIFVFDKTGTLTKGNFVISEITPIEKKDDILRIAAIAEQGSNHPIAKSIIELCKPSETGYLLEEVSGSGIIATKAEKIILCGNEKLMEAHNINYIKQKSAGTTIYVAENGQYVGSLLVKDEIKKESKEAIYGLKNCKTIMLTGDNKIIAKEVAEELKLSDYKASLLPQDKVSILKEVLDEKSKSDVLCFVGDGINDAPALMIADIGISMGGVGSDAAIEASDIVLMYDDLRGICEAKSISKKVMNIVKQNIIFAIGIKVLVLVLSAIGISNMWMAVFADVGVAVIAILNAMRANKK